MKIKKGDMIIVLVLIISVCGWLLYSSFKTNTQSSELVIEVNGEIKNTILIEQLAKEQQIHMDLNNKKYIDITIDNSGAIVSDVTCPDKLCQKTGKITKTGQSIVCLPNKVVIYIKGKANMDIDGVSY